MNKIRGRATIEERVAEFGPAARARWQPHFKRAGVSYPPSALLFVGLKQEKILEVWAADASAKWHWLRDIPIVRASGKPGPKLREGDLQVPEGVYEIESLNPNSAFHLALRVNYPNADDQAYAALENRTNLGGDIMIHGGDASIGCLAVGDAAAEDLFVLAAETGITKIRVLLCPLDLRRHAAPELSEPAWTPALYRQLKQQLAQLSPKP